MTTQALQSALLPLTQFIAALALDQDAQRALQTAFPAESLEAIEVLARTGHEQGWLTPRTASESVQFGRIAKAGPQTQGLSIDAVHMEGEAAEHTHPLGEVSLCFATSGEPRFDGHPPGWVVLEPGSHHTPTVRGGTMLILYFLPDGAVRWGPADA